jgi:hypothetical protein
MQTIRFILLALLYCPTILLAQYGNALYRGANIHSGNRVQTWFMNNGLIGNVGEISCSWPAGTGNEYMGDFTPLLGLEFIHPSGDTLHSVATCDGPRGSSDGPPGGGMFWGLEPVPGYFATPPPEPERVVAMSTQPDTWPSEWAGLWRGPESPGVPWGSEESYFMMDDHADGEWFARTDSLGNVHHLYPFPWDSTRRGLGIQVETRMIQFTDSIYQDALILMYIVHNDGAIVFPRASFGFVLGTMMGGRQDSRDDLSDYYEALDLVYSFDADDQGSPGWVPVRPGINNVGYFGCAFLKTPGDRGLTAFDYFAPPGAVRMNNDPGLWTRLQEGRMDTVQPSPEDGDAIMGTGYFSLAPGQSDTVIAALVFAADLPELDSKVLDLRQLAADNFHLGVTRPRVLQVAGWALCEPYPNPFNESVRMQWSLDQPQLFKLELYDLQGRLVQTLLDKIQPSGSGTMTLAAGSLASGSYYLNAVTGSQSITKRLVHIK